MQHVLDLIREHGEWFYLLTFVWTALEGETFVIFAGLAAQRGFLTIEYLFLAAWLGSFCGDQAYFWIGRHYGTRVLTRTPRIRPKVDKVLGWLEKYSVAFILSYRFMYGVRNVSGLAIGMSRLPWRRFAFWNCVASFVWALSFCGAGYLFGDVIARLGSNEEENLSYGVREFMMIALGLFAVAFLIRSLYSRWKKRQLSNPPPPPEN